MEFILENPIKFWGENKDLPDPELVLFYKELERREIWLDNELTWDTASILVKFIHYVNATAKDDMTPITLRIMSPGGELSTMFALYHTIVNSKVPVHTINMCDCHSAAFLIFLAGHKRTMLPDARFVAHEGSGVVGGTFRETKAAMLRYEKDVARMAELIASRTNLTVEEVKKNYDTESDWYIDEAMARKLGIVTE